MLFSSCFALYIFYKVSVLLVSMVEVVREFQSGIVLGINEYL